MLAVPQSDVLSVGYAPSGFFVLCCNPRRRRSFWCKIIIAHDSYFMTIFIHILGNGAAAHNTDLFIDIALAANSSTSHDTNLISGELVAGIANHCTDATAALINYPSEAWYPYMGLAVDDCSIAWLWFGGGWNRF
ncbi:hypothetical protein [Desulfofarcimen acetoxidans]|uniref:hypothetical protein n=1 Tax=Desulfofarcimen acetoxidans TaxID=58138 RepID=UPI0012FF040A|nr:hypothetical protein [Desulfofarcimen acetoxidans]